MYLEMGLGKCKRGFLNTIVDCSPFSHKIGFGDLVLNLSLNSYVFI